MDEPMPQGSEVVYGASALEWLRVGASQGANDHLKRRRSRPSAATSSCTPFPSPKQNLLGADISAQHSLSIITLEERAGGGESGEEARKNSPLHAGSCRGEDTTRDGEAERPTSRRA